MSDTIEVEVKQFAAQVSNYGDASANFRVCDPAISSGGNISLCNQAPHTARFEGSLTQCDIPSSAVLLRCLDGIEASITVCSGGLEASANLCDSTDIAVMTVCNAGDRAAATSQVDNLRGSMALCIVSD